MHIRLAPQFLFLIAFLSCWPDTTPSCVLGDELDLAQLYQQARPAAVEILVDGHLSGSGCLVDQQGLIVTAAHVVGRPDRRVEVFGAQLARQTAQVVAVDLGHDLLLLRIAALADGVYPSVTVSDQALEPGSEIYLFSSAVFRHELIQRGFVAREGLTFEHQAHFIEVIQAAAFVQEGTSGGPWLDRQGRLVGVQSGMVTSKSLPAGIANIAPAAAIAKLLAAPTHAQTSTIGIFVDELWVLQEDALRRFPRDATGVYVQSLQADGPAARAGLEKGELITAVDGQAITRRDVFLRALRQKKPAEQVELQVVSPDGTGTRKVTVTLGHLEIGWM